jgi:hypothetical protein
MPEEEGTIKPTIPAGRVPITRQTDTHHLLGSLTDLA